MKCAKNVSLLEQLLRVLLAEVICIVSIFWLFGIFQIVGLIFSFIIFFTGVTGYCALYKVLGMKKIKKEKKLPHIYTFAFGILFLIIGLLAMYYHLLLKGL